MERNESVAALQSSTPASSNEEGESEPEEVYDSSGSQFNKKRKVLNVVTPEVAAALDRTGTSSRSATYILAAIRKDYEE